MKRSLLLGWVCALGITIFAQEDPVLMRINGKEVPRSEFEYFYQLHSRGASAKLSPTDYAQIFINRKLKVAAARTAGLDTIASFRKAQEAYRTELLKSYLTDERVTDSCARVSYNKMKINARDGEVQVMQIFKYLPQNITPSRLRADQARMDSLHHVIKNQADVNNNFSLLVDQFSDDKQCRWIKYLQTTSEFEDVAFSLAKGEVSQPFLTPAGIHILKVVDRREMPSFETIRGELTERMNRGGARLDKGTEALVERLKKEYQYTANTSGIEELFSSGVTDKTLFTIERKTYTGEMFKRFASSHPQALKRQLDGFIAKSVLEYEKSNVERKHPEARYANRANEENALIAQISRQKVDLPADNDRAGLATYFKFHQEDYQWETPRYRGVVLHCADKKTAKQAKKITKKVPQKEWADVLRKTLNTAGEEKIKVEQGTFAEGDNKYIDKLVYKKGTFEPVTSHPFTAVAGKKQQGPSEYREVIDKVRKDYRNYLDVRWTQELRASGKVEINQEDLKTVNND